MQLTLNFNVYSPRWGHHDMYTIEFTEDEIKVTALSKTASYKINEHGEFVWTGYNDISGNPLNNIFSNDQIFPPTIFIFALETAWKEWISGELDDTQIENELNELFNWLNIITENRPGSDFWIRVF